MDTASIIEIIAERNPNALFADGFEDALVGHTTGFLPGAGGFTHTVAVYDRQKCLDILMRRDGMTYDEADEFFSFNTEGAYMGEHGPVYVEFPEE